MRARVPTRHKSRKNTLINNYFCLCLHISCNSMYRKSRLADVIFTVVLLAAIIISLSVYAPFRIGFKEQVTLFSWDWGKLIRTAMQIAQGGANNDPVYYLRYPNNQFWLSFLTLFFKSIRFVLGNVPDKVYTAASMLFSIALVRLSCFFIYKACFARFGSTRANHIVLFLMLFSYAS